MNLEAEHLHSKTHSSFSPNIWKALKVKRIIRRGFDQ